MLTGREALGRIDAAIAAAEQEAADLGARLEAVNKRQLVLLEEERVCFADLARFRVSHAMRDRVAGALDGVGRKVVTLLEKRQEALQALQAETATTSERLGALGGRRDAAAAVLEEVSNALDEAEAEVQATLQENADYRAQLETVEAAERVASEAEAKRELASGDRKEKGAPYEADSLFMYLWGRGYGTAEYRGSGLTRALDRWVARLVDYEAARRNYFMLLEIPRRLKEHVEAMRARADADLEVLVGLEEAARDDSDVPALEARHKTKREALDGIDTDIATLEAELAELARRRAAFTAGTDEDYGDIVKAVSDGLEENSLRSLKAAATRTPEPEDEEIVERLQRVDEDLEEIQDDRKELATLQETAEARVADLRNVRQEFRRKRYDDTTSEFEDDNLFGTLLREFIRGAVTGSDYWVRVDRRHKRKRRKSRPEFGSGRFRFPGPTTFPGSRGGRSSGGFRTGGGFGGGRSSGGFKTGGGF